MNRTSALPSSYVSEMKISSPTTTGVEALTLSSLRARQGNCAIVSPFGRIDRQQSAAGEHEHDVAAGDLGDDGAGIAGQVVAGFPADFAGRFVERDDRRSRWARTWPSAA